MQQMHCSSSRIDNAISLGSGDLLQVLTSSAANFSTAVNGVLSGTLSLQQNNSCQCD